MFTACLDVRRVAQISRERSIFLSLLQKSLLREKKKLHLGQINTSSDQSKMDGTSDPLNLLEQKVIRPLSEHSCKMPTTAERTRTNLQEQLVEDTQTALKYPAESTDLLISFYIVMCSQR